MYRIRVSGTAQRDIRRILHHLESEFPASSAAEQWLDQLERRLETLREFPHRCPRAPEDEAFPQMIRQLLVDPYRVLFTVYQEQVWILHIRHQRRRGLDPELQKDLP